MDMPWICQVDREWLRLMTWNLRRAHKQGQGCTAKSQSCTTIKNGGSLTSSGIALESLVSRESQSRLVIVALNRQAIAWLRPEEVQEIESLRRACGEALCSSKCPRVRRNVGLGKGIAGLSRAILMLGLHCGNKARAEDGMRQKETKQREYRGVATKTTTMVRQRRETR